ncbi:DUF397 domain-containing protein [Saccharothrix violaceirubra]|uniref:DUF397 domain-containing protein n=1 Tax=Saccharothrix violaceirubra TaxID=413306 RepID=A0A7W7T340_9PSEU|nr:DUF397 domain-containing protein [Saccharothrix violaceirubra]MBB4965707.1 hypothetical protein [Saccharothrix violaceirubra]
MWRKSSRSGASNGGGDANCVEVHANLDAIRDSKNPTAALRFPVVAVRNFVAAIKR